MSNITAYKDKVRPGSVFVTAVVLVELYASRFMWLAHQENKKRGYAPHPNYINPDDIYLSCNIGKL
jgi:hypothetical protein